jgi:hypothetical protein
MRFEKRVISAGSKSWAGIGRNKGQALQDEGIVEMGDASAGFCKMVA